MCFYFCFVLHGCSTNSFVDVAIPSNAKTFNTTLVLIHCRKYLERMFFVFYFVFVVVFVVAVVGMGEMIFIFEHSNCFLRLVRT